VVETNIEDAESGERAPREQTARPLRALLSEAAEQLLARRRAEDAAEARLEAELLYGEAAALDRAQVIARGAELPDAEAWSRFEELFARRLAGEPLAYITGRREFYGLSYLVGPGALIPRPETETLVEAALAAVREHPAARRQVRVVDVGAGPGTVALAIARHASSAAVVAIDASTAALAWAGRNRRRLGLVDRVVLLAGDLLEPLSEPVDVVVANLPYIPSAELALLPAEIREAEPTLAVDGGEDGLDVIRRFIEQLPAHLAEGPSAVLLEVGAGQAAFVEDLLREALGPELEVRRHRDLRGIARVVEARQRFAAL
jgi:release factor glutamine methyltransferase